MFNDNKTFINVNEEIRREIMKRYSFFLALAAMLVLSFGLANGASVSLSNVETGYSGADTVATGQPIVWTFNFANSSSIQVIAVLNGFVLYSSPESSVTWEPPVLDTLDLFALTGDGWKSRFDLILAKYPRSGIHPPTTGMGRDTVAIGASRGAEGAGFEVGFSSDVVTVTIPAPGIPDQFDGGTICIDSTTYDHNVLNEWLWVQDGNIPLVPSWDGPHCYTILKVPNQPPDITNCQASLVFDHTELATYQFTAEDRDTIGARPLTFVQDSGAGSTTLNGMWSYAPTAADVGQSLFLKVSAQDDPGNLGPPCRISLEFINQPLVFDEPPGFISTTEATPNVVGKGNTIVVNFGPGTQADGEPTSFHVRSVTPMPAGGGAAYGFNNSRSSSLFFFNTQDADGGILYTFIIGLTDGIDTLEIPYHIDVLIVEPYQVVIEKTHNTVQGGHELVCVTLEKGSEQLWGFDFLIAYDASALSFQRALEGNDLYANGCGWEYFNYRFGASGNCSGACPSGKLRVVGIAETNNGPNHPNCYLPALFPAEMFCLDFLVTADQTFECQYIPVRFYWLDCGDNTISFNPSEDITGFVQKLAISRAVIDFDLIGNIANSNVGYPTAQGAQDSDCFPVDADPEKPTAVRFIDFINGGIDIICVEDHDDRGDINLNGVANEVADAVLFTNYFIYGIGVFTTNPPGQIAATDVNADGLTLSVADLVYLIRIVLGDAQPFAKIVPVEAIYTVDVNGILKVDIEVGAAALQLQGNVEPTLLADNMEMEYAFDAANNVTRVLIYSDPKGEDARSWSFTGEFINTNGSAVVSIEMATYEGAPIIAKEVELPTVFALNQNYPNPFNPSTNISFALPTASNYTLTIYNVAGQKVADFAGNAEAGIVNVEWDASNQASGVYFYRVVADFKDGQFKDTKKMVLLK